VTTCATKGFSDDRVAALSLASMGATLLVTYLSSTEAGAAKSVEGAGMLSEVSILPSLRKTSSEYRISPLAYQMIN
jgi:hypothetical protein